MHTHMDTHRHTQRHEIFHQCRDRRQRHRIRDRLCTSHTGRLPTDRQTDRQTPDSPYRPHMLLLHSGIHLQVFHRQHSPVSCRYPCYSCLQHILLLPLICVDSYATRRDSRVIVMHKWCLPAESLSRVCSRKCLSECPYS